MSNLADLNIADDYAEHLETEIEFIHVEFANEKAKLTHEIEILKAENRRLVVLNRVLSDGLTKLSNT